MELSDIACACNHTLARQSSRNEHSFIHSYSFSDKTINFVNNQRKISYVKIVHVIVLTSIYWPTAYSIAYCMPSDVPTAHMCVRLSVCRLFPLYLLNGPTFCLYFLHVHQSKIVTIDRLVLKVKSIGHGQ